MSSCSNVVTMLKIKQPSGSLHRSTLHLVVGSDGSQSGSSASLLLDMVSDELDAGSLAELLSGATDELLELSEDEGEEIRGAPEDMGGSKELLLGKSSYGGMTPASWIGSIEELLSSFADESASTASLLRCSPLEEMSM